MNGHCHGRYPTIHSCVSHARVDHTMRSAFLVTVAASLMGLARGYLLLYARADLSGG